MTGGYYTYQNFVGVFPKEVYTYQIFKKFLILKKNNQDILNLIINFAKC
jgi:hypothetical protein